jgi:hypothetical protein
MYYVLSYYRIWKIHPEESFAFSTKERVPILLCLEVVDYGTPVPTKAEKLARWAMKYSTAQTFGANENIENSTLFSMILGHINFPIAAYLELF